ncbi:hypothetical protein CGRA01v4_11618 [Colletotrichum graminicola]|nr:hypothetical protein CGRA01v4_11618 [Colletotrichum graminicola]
MQANGKLGGGGGGQCGHISWPVVEGRGPGGAVLYGA